MLGPRGHIAFGVHDNDPVLGQDHVADLAANHAPLGSGLTAAQCILFEH